MAIIGPFMVKVDNIRLKNKKIFEQLPGYHGYLQTQIVNTVALFFKFTVTMVIITFVLC